MKKAIVTGSFDPVTVGHLSLIRRASEMFDEVYVVIFINPEKTYMFSAEKRKELLKKACERLENVTVDYDDGYVVDYCARHGIKYIVRGLRRPDHAEYELNMAKTNRSLNPDVETILLPVENGLEDVCSTFVRNNLEDEELTKKNCPWYF